MSFNTKMHITISLKSHGNFYRRVSGQVILHTTHIHKDSNTKIYLPFFMNDMFPRQMLVNGYKPAPIYTNEHSDSQFVQGKKAN